MEEEEEDSEEEEGSEEEEVVEEAFGVSAWFLHFSNKGSQFLKVLNMKQNVVCFNLLWMFIVLCKTFLCIIVTSLNQSTVFCMF